jgi:hypothetical protein
MCKKRLLSGHFGRGLVGVLLANHGSEHQVFRVAVFSVVLSLAVGPNTTLLCRAWCDPPAAATGCHHRGDSSDSPSLVREHHCDDRAPNSTAFLKEDVRRSRSSSNADPAITITRSQVAPARTDARLDHELGHLPSLEKRPLETALRI